MYEARVVLTDAQERHWFHQLMNLIEERRRTSSGYPVPPVDMQDNPVPASDIQNNPMPDTAPPVVDPAVVGAIKPEISDAELEAALRAYLGTHKAAEAIALVQSYGVRRVQEIPADRRHEFLAAVK